MSDEHGDLQAILAEARKTRAWVTWTMVFLIFCFLAAYAYGILDRVEIVYLCPKATEDARL